MKCTKAVFFVFFVCLLKIFVLKLGFEKGIFATKFHFYIKRCKENDWKKLVHYQRASPN